VVESLDFEPGIFGARESGIDSGEQIFGFINFACLEVSINSTSAWVNV
jgi:hypothetical protein